MKQTKSMKHLPILLIIGCLNFTTAKNFAQTVKPIAIQSLPKKINCPIAEISKAFLTRKGDAIELSLSGNFKFKGSVVSNVSKYANLQSLVIRSSYNKAICHISKITKADHTDIYSGQIIDQDSDECYLLKQNSDGIYEFVKTKLQNIMPTCAQQ